jgi:saccharopine dehydrogenase-like NADP-dependent oxidoreductase
MKVLVLGCGEMAQVAIRDLVEHAVFADVVVGTRHPKRAEAFLATVARPTVRTSAAAIDVGDHAALVALMKRFDVVCNLAGPNWRNAVNVAKAAIGAAVPLVDVSDDWAATLELLDLHGEAVKAGITIVLGLGASPGVTNILAREGANKLDRVDEVHTSWIMRGSDAGGPALAEHLLFSLPHKAFVFADGAMREVRPFVDGAEVIDYPILGPVEVFHIGHPEPLTLSRFIAGVRYADDKATFLPAEVNRLIVDLGAFARRTPPMAVDGHTVDGFAIAAGYLYRECKAMTEVSQTGALRAEVVGELAGKRTRIVYTAAGRIGIGTGIPASIGASLLAIGKIREKGVLPPEACIEPEWFLNAVDMRHIAEVEERIVQE